MPIKLLPLPDDFIFKAYRELEKAQRVAGAKGLLGGPALDSEQCYIMTKQMFGGLLKDYDITVTKKVVVQKVGIRKKS